VDGSIELDPPNLKLVVTLSLLLRNLFEWSWRRVALNLKSLINLKCDFFSFESTTVDKQAVGAH